MSYPKISFVNLKGTPFLPDENGITHIRQFGESWYVELDKPWRGEIILEGKSPFSLTQIPTTQRWELQGKLKGEIARRSGQVTVLLKDKAGKMLNETAATLHIYPASISEQQIEQAIADIGILAISTACCVQREMPVPMGEGSGVPGLGQKWQAGNGMLVTATALLELASVVRMNWSEIEKRPLKSFVTEIGTLEVEKAGISPRSLIEYKLNPFKRRVIGIKRTESFQCLENEFLCYILDFYLRDFAKGLAVAIGSLDSRNLENKFFEQKWHRKDEDFKEFVKAAKRRWRLFQSDREEFKRQAKDKISQLQDCVEWAEKARTSQFIKDIKTPTVPQLNSLRLIESSSYAPILDCYLNLKGGTLEPIQKVLHLLEQIYRGEVRPTWEIYEIWCVVKLYTAFILYADMQPLEGEAHLFESIELKSDGTLELPKNKLFSLVTRNSKFSLRVGVQYEPKLRNTKDELRTPDILLFVEVDGKVNKYVFDAKYRDYTQQTWEQLKKDVMDVAKNRYLQELSLTSAFILHTDIRKDYWGEVHFDRFVREEFGAIINEFDYAGHRYGAIALIPGQDEERQIKRILRLLLQYHNTELCTTCLACSQPLKWGKNVRSSWLPDLISEEDLIERVIAREKSAGNGTALYCSCPQCGDFWVIQNCYGEHHHLLKFKDCFHRNSDHPEFKGKWMYICPECGSDPSLEDLREDSRAKKMVINDIATSASPKWWTDYMAATGLNES
ncbi:nuclease domain-containing protein [Oscillatoria sp. FACHB-1406]|uniref:nuclease domain-containing protein n=1 Tax=Oscillatoria sp. FACHB-1406 TaxID=2692846 RepID=UPI0016831A1D|nr:nuclease domain-containing protein [Oscillatoria sp. FACHB-1406]MBD2579158.1 hypothetical protein [Oscillatoria sp. FACHB-1406]